MQIQATTGLTESQWEELVEMVLALLPGRPTHGRPSALTPEMRVRLTLEHLRTNATQRVLAEHYGCSQPTACRTLAAVLPLIDEVLAGYDNGLDDIGPRQALIVDGTLIPTGRRADQPRLYNGKHKTHGVNVQILSTLDGHPVWASPPMPGADHDLTCFRAHNLHELFTTRTGIADSGYQGHGTTGLVTPVKRNPGSDLSDDRQAFNTDLAGHRALIERVNAWLKAWQILCTRYRRRWSHLPLTIRAVFRLLRYRQITHIDDTL